MASRDEVIRYIYELKGTKDLEKLVPVLDQLGDESGELSEEAAEMLRKLRKLSQLSAQANAFVQLKATLQETGDKLALAKIRAAELQQELSETAEPSSRLTRELERANRAVDDLAAAENRQAAELTRVRNALDAAGVSSADVGKALATLRDRIDQASDRLRTYAAEADRSDKASSKFGTTLLSIGKAAASAVAAGLTAVAGLFMAVIGEADHFSREIATMLNELRAHERDRDSFLKLHEGAAITKRDRSSANHCAQESSRGRRGLAARVEIEAPSRGLSRAI